ncbi:hypothetical protein O6H91_Y060900 [Diphasiastrum complanatum]|nr:hypothetical protein O6H91_Y060900 [Diphasiastrum complanatum]
MAVAGQDIGWVGKKPLRRLGGMADALAMATELGYSVPQEDAIAVQNGSALGGSDKSEALVRVLRELTSVQRNLANLQVELQGRQVSSSHLRHTMKYSCFLMLSYTFVNHSGIILLNVGSRKNHYKFGRQNALFRFLVYVLL